MGDVLDRIKAAVALAASGALADARECPPPLSTGASSFAAVPCASDSADLIARFRAELTALTGRVYGPVGAAEAAATVLDLAHANGAAHVLGWSDAEIPGFGLVEAVRGAGVDLVPVDVETDQGQDARREELRRLEPIPMGLTGALAGLADTGSIVVASGPGRSRIASLLPPVHVALLPVARLYPTMAAWLADAGAEAVKASANVVVITGPSRTADIELTLTLGVHGPREIHVILLHE